MRMNLFGTCLAILHSLLDINLYFLFLALLAEIVGTVGGFGSSVFFVPIANFFFGFQTVLGLTALFHLSSNLSKITLFREGINFRIIFMIGVPAVIFVVLGGILSKFFDAATLEILLGFFLIAISAFFLIRKNFQFKAEMKESIIGGALSGLSAGLLGTGGAIRGLTMAAFNLEKSVFIATSAFIDFGIDLSRSIVYFINGYIHYGELKYVAILFVIGFAGTYLGKKILKRITQVQFREVSLILILLVGIATLFKVVFL